jgi:hypothetical protein
VISVPKDYPQIFFDARRDVNEYDPEPGEVFGCGWNRYPLKCVLLSVILDPEMMKRIVAGTKDVRNS